jgi:hypothetical protein
VPSRMILSSTAGILKHTANVLCMGYKWCNYGCDGSVIKGTLCGGQCAFSAVFRVPMEGFSLRSNIAISTHGLQRLKISPLCSMNNQGQFT